MKYGTQRKIVKELNIPPTSINGIINGYRNASPILARRLADLTKSDPFLWMRGGGTSEQRRAAVEAWADRLQEEDKALG